MAEWKEVETRGYTLLVSDCGEVCLPEKRTTYSYTRLGRAETKTAVFKKRTLKPSMMNMGYFEVGFQHQRKTYKFLVHRLVAMAFVAGYEEGLTVNHINGDKTDNRPENLEWVSKGRNTEHAWDSGFIPLVGEEHPGAKLTEVRVRTIRKLLDQGVSANSLAIVAGVSPSLIDGIRHRRKWAHVSD
ncbi:HNH endonuclease [Aureimonas psammosilenae]|uniref:HNH endonuclease n=1 Tax=Aureimonas psammosilenae TaxID=2495496 RepID=UPI001260B9A0|nr:HNH endonuclease [Aureimonas psammosilenae]